MVIPSLICLWFIRNKIKLVQNNFFNKTKIVNVLEKPNKYSNISSQIIYGEKFKILSKIKNFYKVRILYDNYVGFINKKIKIDRKFKPTHKIKVLKSRIYFGLENRQKKVLTNGYHSEAIYNN